MACFDAESRVFPCNLLTFRCNYLSCRKLGEVTALVCATSIENDPFIWAFRATRPVHAVWVIWTA